MTNEPLAQGGPVNQPHGGPATPGMEAGVPETDRVADPISSDSHDSEVEGATSAVDVQDSPGKSTSGWDTTPLPGVKAHDPKESADDSDLSDDEVAERLENNPEIDSGDGVIPEDDPRRDADGNIGAVPFDPSRRP